MGQPSQGYEKPAWQPSLRRALGLYVVIGTLWVVLSGLLLAFLIRDPVFLARLQMAKEWLWIGLTAALFLWLARRGAPLFKEAAGRLASSQRRYEQMFRESMAVMLVIDPRTGAILDANPAACAFYGYDCSELTRKTIFEINTLPREEVARAMQRTASNESRHYYFRHRLASGEVRDVEVFTGPVQVDDKIVLYSIIHDVTERRGAEQLIERVLDQMKMLYEIGHDIAVAANLEDLLRAFSRPSLDLGSCHVGLFFVEMNSDGKPEWAELQAYAGSSEKPPIPLGTRLHILDLTVGQRFSADPQAVYSISDVKAADWIGDSLLQDLMQQIGGRALAIVPLVARGKESVGFVAFAWPEPHDLSSAERQLYALLAPQLAALLENRRLLAQAATMSDFRKRLLGSLPVGVLVIDKDWRLIEANATLEQMIGLSHLELVGRDAAELVPPDRRRGVRQRFRRTVEGKNGAPFRTELLHKEGARVPVRVTLAALKNAQGETIGLIVTAEDLTARQRTERALQESQQMLQLILDSIPQTVFWKDLNSVYLGCNRAFADDASLASPEEIVGLTDYDLPWSPEETDFYRQVDRRVMGTGQPEYGIVEPQTQADGQVVWLRTNKVPLRDVEGNIIGILGTYEDITAQIQAERALRESHAELQRRNRELTALSEISHALADVGQQLMLSDDLSGILPDLLERLGRAIGVCRAYIFETHTDLAGQPVLSLRHEWVAPGVTSWVGQTAVQNVPVADLAHAGRLIQAGQPYWGLTSALSDGERAIFEQGEGRSIALIPIFSSDHWWGVLGFDDCDQGHIWLPAEIETLKSAAAAIGAAVSRQRVQAAEREQRVLAEALRDTARAISSTLDLDEVFERILSNLGRVVPNDAATIILCDPDTGAGRIVREQGYAERGIFKVALTTTFQAADVANLRAMMETGQPLIIPDVRTYPGWILVTQTAWERSYIGAPIRLEGRIIGFLGLVSTEVDFFTALHAERLQAFADQAAVAIRNARLFADSRRQAGELEALRQLTLAVTTQLDLDLLLQRVVESALQLLGIESGGIYLYRPEDDLLEWRVSVGPGIMPAGMTLSRGEGLSGKVIETGQIMIINDYSSWEGRAIKLDNYPIRAVLAVPIRWGDEMLGVINATATGSSTRVFSDHDAHLLGLFADQAAIAIRNAQLYQSERQQRTLAEALRATAQAIGGTLDLDEVFSLILDSAEKVLPHLQAELLLLRGGEIEVALLRAKGQPEVRLSGKTGFPSLSEMANLRHMADTRQPLIIPDLDLYPAWFRRPDCDYPRSYIGAPICIGSEVIGFLALFNEPAGFFKPSDAELLKAFADQAAVAIKNARLYTESRNRSRRLEALNRITRLGTATLPFDEMLHEMANISVDAIGADVCYIALWDAARQVPIPMAASGRRHEAYRSQQIYAGERTLTEAVLGACRVLVVEEAKSSPYLDSTVMQRLGPDLVLHSALALPLLADERSIGALILDFHQPHSFDADEIVWAEQTAELVALAIAKAQAYTELEARVAARTKELQDANEQLIELTRLKDEFVSNVSHELRTPITSLKIYNHLLSARPDKQEVYLERLRRETERLEIIVEDLLYLSRLDQERFSWNVELVDLNVLAELYVYDRTPLAERRGLQISLERDGRLPLVNGDQASLGQALSALLTNAFNYTPPGGQVMVSTALREVDDRRWATVSVCDTGPGIPADEMPYIFERFYRGKMARDSGTPGTGLGLPIASQIVERHGGRIEASSTGVSGEGACFIIWLPAAS